MNKKLEEYIMGSKKINFPRATYDSAWKQVLDFYFQSFVEYCFPEIAVNIDWSKGYEFLDKELQTLSSEAQIGKRIVDKLIKIFERNGNEIWILCHVEIQAEEEKNFPERMFVYRYRIRDRYKKPTISIAILIDSNPNWRPDVYEESYYGCSLTMRYLVLKILNYKDKRSELEAMNNPFAAVILAQLLILETKKQPEARFHAKTALTRRLYETGWSKNDIIQFYKLMDWLIVLPKDLMIKYHEKVKQIEEEKQMRLMSNIERMGIEKGLHDGEVAVILRLLKHRFGNIPDNYVQRVQEASVDALLVWSERILDTTRLEDVFV